ncbi:MAG: SPFH domain-containing protein [bacterium]
MGLIDFIKKQFIDVIEWTEPEQGILAYRFPMRDNEIQNGGKLTVRDSQLALFVNEGQIADLFKPGLYTLTTQTLPVMTSLQNWDKLFASPFKSDVYFFSTRLQTDQKWGTPTPITIRDKELGPIRVRAYGIYSYRIADPRLFYTQLSGTREIYTTEDLEGQLRSTLLTVFASLFGENDVNFIDMAAQQLKFSQKIALALAPEFAKFGLTLDSLMVQSISLPQELQTRFDEKASMNILGDLKSYAQFQSAASIPLAASNPGGVAGIGAGMGAGVAIGQTMAAALSQGSPSGAAAATEENPLATIEKLHDLMKKGILSSVEFETKKAELLKKIT